jgi:hypothetical protein
MQLRILNPSAETAARDRAARIRLIKVATHGQVVRAAVAAEADRSVSPFGFFSGIVCGCIAALLLRGPFSPAS